MEYILPFLQCILHNIMDIFQGWYKDRTEGTSDYRSFSALYLLLRIGLSCEFAVSILRDYKDSHLLRGLISSCWNFPHLAWSVVFCCELSLTRRHG